MTKFFRIQGTNVRKMMEVDEAGNRKLIAVIGQVKELLKLGILFPDNTEGNMSRWLLLSPDGDYLGDFQTLNDAKAEAYKMS